MSSLSSLSLEFQLWRYCKLKQLHNLQSSNARLMLNNHGFEFTNFIVQLLNFLFLLSSNVVQMFLHFIRDNHLGKYNCINNYLKWSFNSQPLFPYSDSMFLATECLFCSVCKISIKSTYQKWKSWWKCQF